MSELTVQVIKVENNLNGVSEKTGKSYTYSELVYSFNGDVQKRKVLDKGLRDLLATSIQPNDTVVLGFVKEGQYNQLKTITKAGAESAKPASVKTTSTTTPYADRDLGMQVGNALTNAVALMVAGHDEVKGMSLREAAMYIVAVGNKMKEDMSNV